MNMHWYLVGHRAGARIFAQPGIKPELQLVRHFENAEGKLKTSELVSDRQGRSDSGNMKGHNAVGGTDSPRQHVLDNFARELGDFLEEEAGRNAFTSLVLVAEPHFLGTLKQALGKGATSRLRETLPKDLVNVSDHDMAATLEGVLCMREEIRP